MENGRRPLPYARFFAGLAEYALESELGVADPPLVDYLGQLLARFIACDQLARVRNPTGRRLQEVGEMLLEAEARIGEARRDVYRHIGDYALFWTGVFPEALPRMQARSRLDRFLDYAEQGKRSYRLASELPAEDADENAVLERLSHEFELCAQGLQRVRQEWQRYAERSGPGPAGLLLD